MITLVQAIYTNPPFRLKIPEGISEEFPLKLTELADSDSFSVSLSRSLPPALFYPLSRRVRRRPRWDSRIKASRTPVLSQGSLQGSTGETSALQLDERLNLYQEGVPPPRVLGTGSGANSCCARTGVGSCPPRRGGACLDR